MPSKPDLSIKLLVEHLANIKPEGSLTASDTALDHIIGHGDVNSVLNSASVTAEGRDRFMRNVVKLIENDVRVPVEHSLARFHWLTPALQKREPSDPIIALQSSANSHNLFEQFAGLAMMQGNFQAQLHVLGMSNNLPASARGILEPINAVGLSLAINHAFMTSRNALLDDIAPFKQFKALAEVAAKRCDFNAVDEDDEMESLGERIASLDVIISKFSARAAKPAPDDATPTRSGKRRKPPKPRRDPP